MSWFDATPREGRHPNWCAHSLRAVVYQESAKTRQARRVRRAAKVLQFTNPENGRRVVPYLALDPPQPEEAPWAEHYLDLADRALNNRDLENPAEVRPPRRRRA